jgi:hypothetical protein
MKPIEQEIIDFADDFFFHLSPNQLKERWNEFGKKQKDTHHFITTLKGTLEDQSQGDNYYRLFLILDYCYSKANLKLRVIKQDEIFKQLDWQDEKVSQAINSSLKGKSEVSLTELTKAIGGMNQDALMFYFEEKIKGIENVEPKMSNPDSTQFFMTLMTMAYLYQKELQKQMN